MNKIRIIDLLNKIANGEEVPKKIKYNNIDYFWCKQCKIYERLEDDDIDLYNDLDDLNDEVEILEEEKKIPEKIPEEIIVGKKQPTHRIKKIEKKINEIISYLDYLKSKGE